MAAGGETLIAGQYTVTWNAVAMGIMEGDAGVPTLEPVEKAEMVDNTDKYGKSTIDGFYQGADWFAQFMCMEYKAGPIAAFWPWGTMGLMGVISRSLYTLSAALVLTAIAGTPAAATPATLTASHALLQVGYSRRLLYGPTLRKVPIRMQLYPYDTGSGVLGWFTQT